MVFPDSLKDREQAKFIRTPGNNTAIRVFPTSASRPENSTRTTLGIGGVYTGTSMDILGYSVLSVSVFSNVASATNGLSIQQSVDNVNWDFTDDFTIPANRGKTFTVQPIAPYFRVVYTNGSLAQTAFRLETIAHSTYIKPSSHRIQDSIISDDDAELSKAVITGQSDDGIFRNAAVNTSDRLEVVSQPYTYSIAEGDVLGHSSLLKFGTRTTVAAATQSLIWEGPTAQYVYMSTAQQLKVSSSSTQDATSGTGLHTLTILGLDSNWDEISETITLTGTNVVTTSNSYIRVFRAYGATSGTSYTNVGTITITNNAGTTTQLVIPAGDGQTLMTLWTVPRNKTLYITQVTFSSDTNKGARVSLYVRQQDGGTLYPWQIKYRAYCFSGNEVFPFNIPLKIPEKTDIEIRTTTPAGAGNISAGATFEGWYE
jgi:hypothetical protein